MGALVKGGELTKIAFAPVAPGAAEVRRARSRALARRAALRRVWPRVSPPRPLPFARRPAQVRVRVLFCGMCHSDCHKIDDDWHDHVKYPMVRACAQAAGHT